MLLILITSASLKVNAQETAAKAPSFFIDADGDKITILDTAARAKLKATKEIKPTTVYDNEENIEKFKNDFEKDVLSKNNLKYGIYIVEKGDKLSTISMKLYGTSKRSSEIQLVNEAKLKNTTIKTGMKLKYIIYEKEVENVGTIGKNANIKKD